MFFMLLPQKFPKPFYIAILTMRYGKSSHFNIYLHKYSYVIIYLKHFFVHR